jgi:hypothetical protein
MPGSDFSGGNTNRSEDSEEVNFGNSQSGRVRKPDLIICGGALAGTGRTGDYKVFENYAKHGDTAEALISRADVALYRSKINGRNQVELASQASKTQPALVSA